MQDIRVRLLSLLPRSCSASVAVAVVVLPNRVNHLPPGMINLWRPISSCEFQLAAVFVQTGVRVSRLVPLASYSFARRLLALPSVVVSLRHHHQDPHCRCRFRRRRFHHQLHLIHHREQR